MHRCGRITVTGDEFTLKKISTRLFTSVYKFFVETHYIWRVTVLGIIFVIVLIFILIFSSKLVKCKEIGGKAVNLEPTYFSHYKLKSERNFYYSMNLFFSIKINVY